MITGTGLTVHELGAESSPNALVLMHGLTDSGECWPDAVRRWGTAYRIFAVDARGHGQSPRFTTEELTGHPGDVMLADAVSLLEELAGSGVDRPVVVGHSMGGALAGAAAALRPDLVRAAVLEDPAWGTRPDDDEVRQAALERLEWTQEFRDDLASALAKGRAENPTWPEVELGPWAGSKRLTDPPFLETGIAWPSTPWDDFVRRLAVPTLVVTGDQEVLIDSDVQEIVGGLGNQHVTVSVVPGAGHCVRRDATEAFHALVDPWIAARFA